MRPRPASRRNEPCFLPHIIEQVALLRGEEATTLAQQCDNNARELFRLN